MAHFLSPMLFGQVSKTASSGLGPTAAAASVSRADPTQTKAIVVQEEKMSR